MSLLWTAMFMKSKKPDIIWLKDDAIALNFFYEHCIACQLEKILTCRDSAVQGVQNVFFIIQH